MMLAKIIVYCILKGIKLSDGRVLAHTKLHAQPVSVTHARYKVPGALSLKINLQMTKK